MYNYLKSYTSFHWFVVDSRFGIGVFMANALLHQLHGTTTSNLSVAQTSLSIHWKHTANIFKAQTSWIFHFIYSGWSAMAWSEDNLWKNHVDPRDRTQIGGLGDMHLHPLEPSGCLRSFQTMFSYASSFITTIFYGTIPLIKCLISFPFFNSGSSFTEGESL